MELQDHTQNVSIQRLLKASQTVLTLWESPLWSGLLALAVYMIIAPLHGPLFGTSITPYYNYLADAFLHGRLSLRLLPPRTADLVHYAGQYFLYWPPFPAILMMPFIALFGVGFSDITFTLFLGALNVALIAYLLRLVDRRGVVEINTPTRALLTLFFAFGTVQFILAPRGRVWFTGQEVGFLFAVLAYIAVLRFRGWKAFLLAGLCIAAAASTRNNMVFVGIWPAYYLLKEHWPQDFARDWKRLAGYALLGAAPVIAAVALLALYNYVRFGSPTNVGLDYHLMAREFVSDYHKYGAFNLHYVPINLYYQYIFYPFPMRSETMMGGSLFLLSPLFFAIFFAFYGPKSERISMIVLVISILLVNVAILLLMGTGWMQIGPRYTLDFTVPLLMLTARGMKKWPAWLIALCFVLSVAQYLYGSVLVFPPNG